MRIGTTCYPAHGKAGQLFQLGDVEHISSAGAELLLDEAPAGDVVEVRG